MADPVDELLKEIAAKHGIAVGRDDPLLILQTINARLMQDSAKSQQEILDGFKSELEAIAARWGHDAKEKAERILNAALDASKEAMRQAAKDSAKEFSGVIRSEVDKALQKATKPLEGAKRVAYMNIAAGLMCLVSVILLLLVARH